MDGRIIADRYILNTMLGRGGMGEVWTAVDTRIEREVAVKLLPPQSGTDGTELFLREARTAGGLTHVGVVTIHDLGQDHDGTFYLVMERVIGRDLSQVLRANAPLKITDVIEWTSQAADALAVAHAAHVVHRDLKPANVMLTDSGTVKILDFGIARYITAATEASRIIGTLHYMPPERLMGKAGDGRGDLYSLGCMLHELLTSMRPFGDLDSAALMFAHVSREPAPPSTHRPDIPPALDQLVLELLAKDPDHRPANAEEVRDRLRALITPVPPKTATHPPMVRDIDRASPTNDGSLAVGPVLQAPKAYSPTLRGSGAVSSPTGGNSGGVPVQSAAEVPVHAAPTQSAALAPHPLRPVTPYPPSTVELGIFKGYMAVATLHSDRVEIRRSRIAKLAGHKDSTTYFSSVLKPHEKPATPLVNGYVHLATENDPPHLRLSTGDNSKSWVNNERSILFTWNQRDTQASFLAAVLGTWHQAQMASRRVM
ncbi:protein kinase [Streptomyces sp. NPDC060194]|uniref:serine/threonine-protein kinase n=1 Tax=Streptomyces sp. NPDC060194 TaxID=3347069 RepID=UPI0036624BA7